MARIMRHLAETTGMNPGEGLEKALGRLEAGDDPEAVEADLSPFLDGDDILSGSIRKVRRRFTPPRHDDTLYLL